MGSDGTRGPKPFVQHKASTLFLRVPHDEFRAIVSGRKTEFRGLPGKSTLLQGVELPTPVVAYSVTPKAGKYRARLMVMDELWQEPVGSISEESLRREGHASLAHFRRYWIARTKKRFRPTRKVVVYRVHPWNPDEQFDRAHFGSRLLQALYGGFLSGGIVEVEGDG